MGLVDGSNKRFRVRQSPVKPNTLTVYVGGVEATATLVSPDVVIMDAAPVAQPYADYTHQPLTDRQARQLMMDGITEAEMRWPRGLRLSSSNVSYVAATEDDTNIYVLAQSTVADPSDEVNLSESETQRGLLVACASYVYRLSDLVRFAQAAVSVRGTAGGMTLDRRSVPDAMLQVMAFQDKRLTWQFLNAQVEWTGGDCLGEAFDPIVTKTYMDEYEWQTTSKLEDWFATYRYNPSDVDLEEAGNR